MPIVFQGKMSLDVEKTLSWLVTAALLVAAGTVRAEFQGVDSAANWLARKGSMILADPQADSHAYTIGQIADANFRQVRERLNWEALNPGPGKFVLEGFLADCRTYAAHGIAVDWVFHSAPAWTKPKGNLPTDMRALYDFCRTLAAAAPDGTSWEFWNEEDIDLCKAPAWDYATAAKVAYLGFKAGRPKSAALMGALCKSVDGPYNRTLFANDLGYYTDAFNFHVYAVPSAYEGLIASIRRFCGACEGLAGRAVWVTENGTHQEGHCAVDGVMPGLKAHSAAQELVQAEFAVKSQVLMQMAGVMRSYLFVFPPYNEREGAKDWGFMRRDGSLKPAVPWLREKNRSLDGFEIVGELPHLAEGVRAFAYRAADGRETLVYWAESAVETAESVDCEKECPVERPFVLRPADGSVRHLVARRRPAYLEGLAGLPVARRAAAPGAEGVAVPADIDQTLVARLRFADGIYKLADSKSTAEVGTDEIPAELEVWNFGSEEKVVSLVCESGKFVGQTAGVRVPSFGKAVVAGRLSPADPSADCSSFAIRAVRGKIRSTRLSVPIVNFAAWSRRCLETALPWREAANWRFNDSADSRTVAWDETERAMRFDLAWQGTDQDRWTYPTLVFDPRLAKGAEYLVFEVRSEQDKVENDFRCANVIADYVDRNSAFLGFEAPVGAWETRRVRLSEGLRALRIGMNPNGRRLTYWLRNVRFLGRR